LEINGTYDSGSQISLINAKLVKIIEKVKDQNKIFLRTVNGVTSTEGLITIKARIFDTEEDIDVFIVKNENFENFIIGLDMIKKFRLVQNENLEIKQMKDFNARKIDNKIINTYLVNFNEHIKEDEFEIKIKHLDKKKKIEIEKIIEKHKVIFAKDKYDIGKVKDYEAKIDLVIDKYSSKRPYRCSIEDKKEIEEQISKLLEKHLIEESYSPFAAPVTLALKKDENKKLRLCINFRDLNKNIIPQAKPFPIIDDLIIKTRNCKYFTTLDINTAFWSIPLRIEDRRKTAFVTQEGHY